MPAQLHAYISGMRPFVIAIELDGRHHAGTWTLHQGSVIHVGCAWGADKAEIGAAAPEIAARELLVQIVRDGQARHAASREAHERLLESLGRRPRR